jgi:hypothetical protein
MHAIKFLSMQSSLDCLLLHSVLRGYIVEECHNKYAQSSSYRCIAIKFLSMQSSGLPVVT